MVHYIKFPNTSANLAYVASLSKLFTVITPKALSENGSECAESDGDDCPVHSPQSVSYSLIDFSGCSSEGRKSPDDVESLIMSGILMSRAGSPPVDSYGDLTVLQHDLWTTGLTFDILGLHFTNDKGNFHHCSSFGLTVSKLICF